MPRRHERPRLRKQQKEHAVDDGDRLFQHRRRRHAHRSRRSGVQRPRQIFECLDHPRAERFTHHCRMFVGRAHHIVQETRRAVRFAQGFGAGHGPEQAGAGLGPQRHCDVRPQPPPRPAARRIEHEQRHAVAHQRPRRASARAVGQRHLPPRVERLAPWHCDHRGHRRVPAPQQANELSRATRLQPIDAVAQHVEDRQDAQINHRPYARRRTQTPFRGSHTSRDRPEAAPRRCLAEAALEPLQEHVVQERCGNQ